MKGSIRVLLLLTILMLITACSTSEDVGPDVKKVRMPIYLSIPAGDIGASTRAPGDPGSYELFEKPDRLTFFLVVDNFVANDVEYQNAVFDCKINQELVTENWEKVKIGDDYVYTYMGDIDVSLPDQPRTGGAKFYAAVSKGSISFVDTPPGVYSSVTDVLNVQFNISDGTPIKDIYSSPYNWETEDNYYGTIQDFSTDVPYVSNFILYHVAAKLDVIWNVDDDLQSSMNLTELQVLSLKENNCYLFQPTANTTGPLTVSGGEGTESANSYDEDVDINIGNQWYGRHSLYVIPYGVGDNNSKYPVKLKLTGKLGTEKTEVVPVDFKKGGNIFTPWIVAPIEIKTEF